LDVLRLLNPAQFIIRYFSWIGREMASKARRSAIIWIGIAIGVAGCGKSGPKVEFAKVQGAVLVNGRPQPNIQVQFTPDPEKGIGLPAYAAAVSDDKGNYSLKYSYMNKTGEGAPVGWCRVSLLDMSASNSKASAIPGKFGNAATSPLTKEVKTGDNTINLEMQK
jgi:hypothetical protein